MSTFTNEELEIDYLSGLSIKEIANKYGISQQTVYACLKKLRKAGVKLPNRRRVEDVEVDRLNSVITDYMIGEQSK